MNAEMMQERWAQMRREAQQRWNRLTDEDLDHAEGQAHKLVDLVEERYGVNRNKAQHQVDRFMRGYGNDLQAAARTWWQRARDYMGDNPWAAVGLAALLIGALAGLNRTRDR